MLKAMKQNPAKRFLLGGIALLLMISFALSAVPAVSAENLDDLRPSECTTFIVGKDVSTDGSRFFGRTTDVHGLTVCTIENTPAQKRASEWVYQDPGNGGSFALPAESCQFLSTPFVEAMGMGRYDESGVNEYGVSFTTTESIYGSEEALAVDPLVPTGVAESSMPYLVIPYVTTAKEAVERLGNLIEQYGSAEGNAVVFGDDQELWYMEIYTGHQWAAIKFPDDCYAVVANDGLLGYIDIEDTENVLTSKDLITLAEENGFLQEQEGKIHLAMTYCEPKRDYSQIRVWAAQKKLSPSQIGDYDVNTTFSLLMKPDKKISPADIMDLMRYRYEDLPWNVNEHPEVRAIGINRTANAHLLWHRDGKPVVLWTALANPEMSVFVPLYSNTELPEEYSINTADYDPDCPYFKIRRVSAFAVNDREGFGATVRQTWKAMETRLLVESDQRDEQYMAAGCSAEEATAIFAKIAQEEFETADKLFVQGLTQYMDSTCHDGASDTSQEAYQLPPDTSEEITLPPVTPAPVPQTNTVEDAPQQAGEPASDDGVFGWLGDLFGGLFGK